MVVYNEHEITGNPKNKKKQPKKPVQQPVKSMDSSPLKNTVNNSILKNNSMSEQIIKVDESKTIKLIEVLDVESKKTLNALVQSVLMT